MPCAGEIDSIKLKGEKMGFVIYLATSKTWCIELVPAYPQESFPKGVAIWRIIRSKYEKRSVPENMFVDFVPQLGRYAKEWADSGVSLGAVDMSTAENYLD